MDVDGRRTLSLVLGFCCVSPSANALFLRHSQEIYKDANTQVHTLRKMVKEKEEAIQRQSTLEKKIHELEKQGTIKIQKKGDGDISILPVALGSGMVPAGSEAVAGTCVAGAASSVPLPPPPPPLPTLAAAAEAGEKEDVVTFPAALVPFQSVFTAITQFSFVSQCKMVQCQCRCHLHPRHHHLHHHRRRLLSQVHLWRWLLLLHCPHHPRPRHPPCPGQPLPPWCSTQGLQVRHTRVSSAWRGSLVEPAEARTGHAGWSRGHRVGRHQFIT